MQSAFNRIRQTLQITPTVYRAAVADFEKELVDFEVSTWTPEIEASAIALRAGSNLRAMDASHVAAALAVNAERFVTLDARQGAGRGACKIIDATHYLAGIFRFGMHISKVLGFRRW